MSVETEDVDLVGDEVVENVARAALFAALIGAFAYVTFPNPFSPTDVTLQVLGVFLAGIFLGPVWGFASLVLYLATGAAGVPIFIGGNAGIGHLLFSQTAGYLLSYPVAAFAVGVLVHGGLALGDPSEVSALRLVGAMIGGTVIIYAFGVIGLMVVLGLGVLEAIVGGALVFLPVEATKIAAAVGIVKSDAVRAG